MLLYVKDEFKSKNDETTSGRLGYRVKTLEDDKIDKDKAMIFGVGNQKAVGDVKIYLTNHKTEMPIFALVSTDNMGFPFFVFKQIKGTYISGGYFVTGSNGTCVTVEVSSDSTGDFIRNKQIFINGNDKKSSSALYVYYNY